MAPLTLSFWPCDDNLATTAVSADVDASAFDIRRMPVSQALRIVITEQNGA